MMGSVFRFAKRNIITFATSYKCLFVIIVSCVMPLNAIIQLKYIGRWDDATVLDGILYQFGLYTLHYLIFMPLCIFVVYDLVKPSLVENFIFVRFGSRKLLFLSKILSCTLVTFFLLLVLLVMSILVMLFHFRPGAFWGESMLLAQSIHATLLHPSLFTSSPPLVMAYQLFLVLLSFIVLSWMLLFFMEVMKRKSLALVVSMLINFTLLILAKGSVGSVLLLPCANTFLSNVDILEHGGFSLVRPIVYWICMGGLLFILNGIVISRKDMLYDDMPEDAS